MQQQSQKNGSPGKAPHHGGKAWTLEKRPCSGHARHNPMELTPCMHPKVAPRMRAASAPPPPPCSSAPLPAAHNLLERAVPLAFRPSARVGLSDAWRCAREANASASTRASHPNLEKARAECAAITECYCIRQTPCGWCGSLGKGAPCARRRPPTGPMSKAPKRGRVPGRMWPNCVAWGGRAHSMTSISSILGWRGMSASASRWCALGSLLSVVI